MSAHQLNGIAVPVSIRVEASLVLKLYGYAEALGLSSGQLLNEILAQTFPVFEGSEDFKAKLPIAHEYVWKKSEGYLRYVNWKELERKLLKRTVPGGPIGRPPKPRKTQSTHDH